MTATTEETAVTAPPAEEGRPAFDVADPAFMAAMAAAARAAHAAAAEISSAAPADDPRIREVDGGTITLCPGGILVFTPDGFEDRAPEAQVLDAVLGRQCAGTKPGGTRCRRTAPDGETTCNQHRDAG